MQTITREQAVSLVKRWYKAPALLIPKKEKRVSAKDVPRGLFVFPDVDGQYGALNTERGRCEVESFSTIEEATAWLKGEVKNDG